MNREETLKLWRQGKKAWNTWAEEMLADRKQLEESGKWAVDQDLFGRLEPRNYETRSWFEDAKAMFSSEEEPTIFDQRLRFTGCIFPGDISFACATISRDANFDGTTFSGNATFFDTTFSANANFRNATFSEHTSFDNATFSGHTSFDSATFSKNAGFRNATFSEHTSFDNATFSGHTSFDSATFSKNAGFRNATFSGYTGFYNATFSGHTSFDSATFSEYANFDNATFSKNTSFERATFSRDTSFDDTTFSRYAAFNRSTFLGYAGFKNAAFSGNAWFVGASFKGSASYEEAHFQGPALFTAIKAERAFSIADAYFQHVPDFIQANFAEAPRLDNSDFRPGFVQPGRFWISVVKRLYKGDANVPARWRALKRLAIQGHDHEREQQFFPMEIRSARFVTDWPFHWKLWDTNVWNGIFRFWLGLLYQLTSNFGRSVLRPTLLLFASILFFAAIYLGESHKASGLTAPGFTQRFVAVTTVATPFVSDEVSRTANPCADVSGKQIQPLEPDLARRTDAIAEALQLSILNGSVLGGIGGRNTVRRIYGCLYGLVRDTGSKTTPIIPLSVTTWSLLQKAISIVLIFLLGLAIRNILKVR